MPRTSCRSTVAVSAGVADVNKGAGDGDRTENDVDEQGPPPGSELGQYPTEQQADSAAGTSDGAEHTKRGGALLAVRESYRQQGHGGRCEESGEYTLQDTGGHQQHFDIRGETAQHRGDAETNEPDDERPPAPPLVRHPPAE